MTLGVIDTDSWTDHESRYMRTPEAIERGVASTGFTLTPGEEYALHSLIEGIGDIVATSADDEELSEALASHLLNSGRMPIRLLAAFHLEYVLMGDARANEDHVQLDGVLGSAVADAVAVLEPMVRAREPVWYRQVWDGESADSGNGVLIEEIFPGADELRKLVDEEPE